MNLFIALGAVTLAAVLLEMIAPGRAYYQSGWYNAALVALVALVIASASKVLRAAPASRVRAGIASAAFGFALAGIAGAANGLLAPGPQTIVGAPGQAVAVPDLGRSIEFPLIGNGTAAFPAREVDGSFLLRPMPRTVVEVEAFDARGARVTITQPSGSAFLSPVLLMQQQQTIAGMALPFDTFAVPAAHRVVKAVLFTAQQAAALRGLEGSPVAAVLFDAEDDMQRSLPHGIALARDGATISLAGVRLRPSVLRYPALEVTPIPNAYVVSLALAAVCAGVLLAALRPKTASYS